jgi:hypothetical protein
MAGERRTSACIWLPREARAVIARNTGLPVHLRTQGDWEIACIFEMSKPMFLEIHNANNGDGNRGKDGTSHNRIN